MKTRTPGSGGGLIDANLAEFLMLSDETRYGRRCKMPRILDITNL